MSYEHRREPLRHRCPNRLPPGLAPLFPSQEPSPLHPAPIGCLCAAELLAQAQLPGYGTVAALVTENVCAGLELKPVPDHTTLWRAFQPLLRMKVLEQMRVVGRGRG